jgi:hypothetical protein
MSAQCLRADMAPVSQAGRQPAWTWRSDRGCGKSADPDEALSWLLPRVETTWTFLSLRPTRVGSVLGTEALLAQTINRRLKGLKGSQ